MTFNNPEVEEILGGLPDRTGGLALRFFESQTDEDRDITQNYLLRRFAPYQMQGYVHRLVEGYAVHDPTRTSIRGLELATAEILRTKRYLEIFVDTGEEFFPKVHSDKLSAADETDIDVWGSLADPSGFFGLGRLKESVITRSLPAVNTALGFLHDPDYDTDIFDQAKIIARNKPSTN